MSECRASYTMSGQRFDYSERHFATLRLPNFRKCPCDFKTRSAWFLNRTAFSFVCYGVQARTEFRAGCSGSSDGDGRPTFIGHGSARCLTIKCNFYIEVGISVTRDKGHNKKREHVYIKKVLTGKRHKESESRRRKEEVSKMTLIEADLIPLDVGRLRGQIGARLRSSD